MNPRSHPVARVLVAAGCGLLLAGPVAAQDFVPPPGGVVAGDSVRIRPRLGVPVEASLIRWQADTLVLRVVGLATPWPVPASDVRSLERFQVIPPRQAFRSGFILGAAAGLFVGAAVGGVLYATGVNKDPDGPPAEQLMRSVMKYGGLGMVGGGFALGLSRGHAPGEGWVRVSVGAR